MRFADDFRVGGGRWRVARGEPRAAPVDLSAFTAWRPADPARWRHAIRGLDRHGRLRVHELADLTGFNGRSVVATLRRTHWEIRAAGRAPTTRVVDAQHRMVVPAGVRHQLGLDGTVVVSLAVDGSRILVWAAARLDRLVEEG